MNYRYIINIIYILIMAISMSLIPPHNTPHHDIIIIIHKIRINYYTILQKSTSSLIHSSMIYIEYTVGIRAYVLFAGTNSTCNELESNILCVQIKRGVIIFKISSCLPRSGVFSLIYCILNANI